jgi:hypothetical protein
MKKKNDSKPIALRNKKVSPEEYRKAREVLNDYMHKCLVEGRTWLVK